MSQDDLIRAVNTALDGRDSLDAKIHKKHHEFIDTLIIDNQVRKDRKDKIITQVWGWGIIAMLSGIGTAVYHFFIKSNH